MRDPYWTYHIVRGHLQHYGRLVEEVRSPGMSGTLEGMSRTRGADPHLSIHVLASIDGAIERAPLTRKQRDVVIHWVDGELPINAAHRLRITERAVYYRRENAADGIAKYLRGGP